MSRGRPSFNLQDEEAMRKFREYIGVKDGRKAKRMEKNEEPKSGGGNMRSAGGRERERINAIKEEDIKR